MNTRNIDRDDEILVVFVPHQQSAWALSFTDEEELHEYYCHQVERSQGGFEQWIYDCPDDEHTPEAFAAHDLHSVHRFDREDARKVLSRKCRPDRAGSGQHQGLQIQAALGAFIGDKCAFCGTVLLYVTLLYENEHGDPCCSEDCRDDADLHLDRTPLPEDDWRLSR